MSYFPVSEIDDYRKMPVVPPTESLSEASIPELLRGLGPIFGPQVSVDVAPRERRPATRPEQADFVVRVSWQGAEYTFAAEAKTRNTPRVVEDALRQARRWSSESGMLPMVVVPFLGEQRIDRLLQEGVSGLDLCGNGLVMVPGRLLLRRTGQRNRYPESRPARFAYRGTTSLVPRAFLRRSVYASVGQVQEETKAGGAEVALSTVSKALARMADDLVIDRTDSRITLLQSDKLLDLLVENYTQPKAERTVKAKLNAPLGGLFRKVEGDNRVRLVLSGASSQDRYAAGLRSDDQTLYCDNMDELRRRAGDAWQPTERFADITVIETSDPTPFFDARPDPSGVVYASPVQTYLELAANGEKRDREIAAQVRKRVLNELVR